MKENPFKIWSDGKRYTTVSYIEFNDEILFLSMESICEELNKLYNEKEMYKHILKGIMTGIQHKDPYCEITVGIPCHKYEEFRGLMFDE